MIVDDRPAPGRRRSGRGRRRRRAAALPRARHQPRRRGGRRRPTTTSSPTPTWWCGLSVKHQRVAPVTMEANGCVAVPEADGSLTVWASTQSVFGVQARSPACSGSTPTQVRVRAPWIGGGFGAKGGVYPEQLMVAGLAHKVGRAGPMDRDPTREPARHDARSRRRCTTSSSARRATARSPVCACAGYADVGAYPIRGMFIPMVTRMMSSGVYAIPQDRLRRHAGGHEHHADRPVPRRGKTGSGRVGASAPSTRSPRELGIDPAELRRRNFPARLRVPVHDRRRHDVRQRRVRGRARRGPPHRRLHRLARRAARPPASDPDAPLLGIGLGCYVETSGRGGEFGSVEVERRRHGHRRHRQRAARSGARDDVGADRVGHARACRSPTVRVVHSDTALVDHGVGTFGSRSTQLAGSAVREASEVVLDQARALAAELLEASPDDVVVLDDGRLGVAGVPASGRTWAELAAEADAPGATARARARLRLGRVVPVRLPRGRRRDRPRDRRGHAAPDRRGRRLWRRRQPAARRGSGARRSRAGRRADPLRGGALRRRRQPAHRVAARLPRAGRVRPPRVHAPRTPSRRARTTRSARRASASRAPPARSPRSGTRWSTRSRRSVWSTSIRRVRPKWCGGRCSERAQWTPAPTPLNVDH